MVSDAEAKAFGPWLAGLGLCMCAAGLVRLLWPDLAQWDYLAAMGLACGFPVVLAYSAYLVVWVAREWPRPPAPSAPRPATARPDHNHDWRAAAHHFVQWGNAFGFNIRDLALRGEPGRCISWDGWRLMVDYLLAVGVLAGAGQDTRWADDWDLARWQRERHSLPYPARESPPPAVSIFIHHNNSANHGDYAVGEGGVGDGE